jgi:hypothetical protein
MPRTNRVPLIRSRARTDRVPLMRSRARTNRVPLLQCRAEAAPHWSRNVHIARPFRIAGDDTALPRLRGKARCSASAGPRVA